MSILLIDILADMLQNSVFDPGELEKEKGVILEEIGMYEDSPDDLVHEVIAENLLAPHPLGRGVLGTRLSVQRLQREDLLAYVEEHYVPSNLVITAVGNLDHNRVVAGSVSTCLNLLPAAFAKAQLCRGRL